MTTRFAVLTAYESRPPIRRSLTKMTTVDADDPESAIKLAKEKHPDRFVPGLVVPLLKNSPTRTRFWSRAIIRSPDNSYNVYLCTWGMRERGGFLIAFQDHTTMKMYDMVAGYTNPEHLRSLGIKIEKNTYEDVVFGKMREAIKRMVRTDNPKLLNDAYHDWVVRKMKQEAHREQSRETGVDSGDDGDAGCLGGGPCPAGLDGGSVPTA